VVPAAGLPLVRVLTIGIAVADAIAAAHQKGTTHRDLKSATSCLAEGEQAGRIKVLDFGLAKVGESRPGAAGASGLPNVAPAHSGRITAEGRILGTVAYMSPEQAEGKAVDGRSDLVSMGVVLFEMATGQRPFSGDSSTAQCSYRPEGRIGLTRAVAPRRDRCASLARPAAARRRSPRRAP
jgi:serine/threonine-protein kinase